MFCDDFSTLQDLQHFFRVAGTSEEVVAALRATEAALKGGGLCVAPASTAGGAGGGGERDVDDDVPDADLVRQAFIDVAMEKRASTPRLWEAAAVPEAYGAMLRAIEPAAARWEAERGAREAEAAARARAEWEALAAKETATLAATAAASAPSAAASATGGAGGGAGGGGGPGGRPAHRFPCSECRCANYVAVFAGSLCRDCNHNCDAHSYDSDWDRRVDGHPSRSRRTRG